MKQVIDELANRGVSGNHIIYINFEDYKYRNIRTPDALYEYIEAQIKADEKYYLLIDEIQNVDEFE